MSVSFVIFDLDGVLVDSEPLACRALAETLTECGFPYRAADIVRFIGHANIHLRGTIEAESGRPLPEDFSDKARARMSALFRAELKPVGGVPEVLAALTPACCIASNSPPDYIDRALAITGLEAPVPPARRFSAAHVAAPKPAPDLFLHAAARCGVNPADCLVVEDSESGTKGAVAAGMRVLGFLGGGHVKSAEELGGRLSAAGAGGLFDDMRRLPALMKQV